MRTAAGNSVFPPAIPMFRDEMETRMRIAICDDDINLLPFLRNNIIECFHHYKTEVTADSYDKGLDLRQAINNGTFYDVIFLDIDMPNCDGIDLGKYLIQLLPSAYLIFISNMESQVFRSFTAQPFRFVRKSRFNKEIPEAVNAMLKKIRAAKSDDIVITYGVQNLRINPARIVYVESRNNNITIYTENESYTLRHTLRALEAQLDGYGFIRTHKSFLVNYHYIFRFDKNSVILDNQTEIPLSRNYVNSAKKSFQNLLLCG